MSYYDETAKGYQELHGEEQVRKAKTILNYLKENKLINETTRLLDVGCGNCSATNIFPGEKTGLDPSKELLKQCKNMMTVNAKAEELPFADKWFDLVISLTAIHNFENAEKALNEMLRAGNDLFVITLLKKSPKHADIESAIRKLFKVETVLEDPTDTIFILRR